MKSISSRSVQILSAFCLLPVLFACQAQNAAPAAPTTVESSDVELVPIAYQATGEETPAPSQLFKCLPLTRGRAVIPSEDPEVVEPAVVEVSVSERVLPVQLPFETPVPTPAARYIPPAEATAQAAKIYEPAYADPSLLTRWSEITGLGGTQMYGLYLRMWADKTGWWWQAFGDGGYTVWDFISTFSYYESSGYTRWADVMAEAGVRWYYETGGVYGTPGSIEGVLNWWGAFSESSADVFYAGPNYVLRLPWRATLEEIEQMRVIGDSFENPPADWKLGFDAERPFGWGNLYICYSDKDLLDERRKLLLKYPHAIYINFGEGNTTFIVPSGCAWATGYHLWYDNWCATVEDYTYSN